MGAESVSAGAGLRCAVGIAVVGIFVAAGGIVVALEDVEGRAVVFGCDATGAGAG
jgi:hypothetical protein